MRSAVDREKDAVTKSVGLWDALFGEKCLLSVPSEDGAMRQVEVTKKWLDKMEREGHIAKTSHESADGGTDGELQKARGLVQEARFYAEQMFPILQERFSALAQVDPEQWEFVITVAGVAIAIESLGGKEFSGNRAEELAQEIANELNRWNADGLRGYQDCERVFKDASARFALSGHEANFVRPDALGLWIVLNLLGRQPDTDDEATLARSLGLFVTIPFKDWWDVSNEAARP